MGMRTACENARATDVPLTRPQCITPSLYSAAWVSSAQPISLAQALRQHALDTTTHNIKGGPIMIFPVHVGTCITKTPTYANTWEGALGGRAHLLVVWQPSRRATTLHVCRRIATSLPLLAADIPYSGFLQNSETTAPPLHFSPPGRSFHLGLPGPATLLRYTQVCTPWSETRPAGHLLLHARASSPSAHLTPAHPSDAPPRPVIGHEGPWQRHPKRKKAQGVQPRIVMSRHVGNRGED